MTYRVHPIERVAESFVEAAFPTEQTPPKYDRLMVANETCRKLANFAMSEVCDRDRGVSNSAIVALAIYVSRPSLMDIINSNHVSCEAFLNVADDLGYLCDCLQRDSPVDGRDVSGERLGAYAELGMLNMVYSGILRGELDLDYAFLLGLHGHERDHSGLRGDVDMVVHTTKRIRKKGEKKKIQIKASDKKKDYLYKDDIIVVTAQGLFEGKSPRQAVSALMTWDYVDEDTKLGVYKKFRSAIG